MAESGINYALHELRYGDWLSRERPFSFESAEIDGKGRFKLTISDSSPSGDIQISSQGVDRYSGVRKTIDVIIPNPASITDYLLSVINLDYDLQPLSRPATCIFGSDGVAATSVTQELHTLLSGVNVTLLAATDPAYAGIVPGSDYVVGDSGEMFGRTDKLPVSVGRYYIDYTSGTLVFSDQDNSRRICIIYDYLRRVPSGSAPVVTLPHSPVREGSNIVWEMQMTKDPPVAKGYYQPDYISGIVRFFEQDSGAIISLRYAFLGSRMTGAVRVNGNIEWHNTNLLYLFSSHGQKITASGRFLYGPNCKITVWNDDGRYGDPSVWSGSNGLASENSPRFEPPAINMDRLRHKAKHSGSQGLYVNNPNDIEFRDLHIDEQQNTLLEGQDEDKEFNWSSYMQRLYRDWLVAGSDNCQNGTYVPAGHLLNLSSVFPPDSQDERLLIFAEGNIILRGSLPEQKHLTVVSERNIYVEDTPGTAISTSLVLIAEGNICINMTRLQPVASNTPPVSLYLNCVAIARRGTLGVIPGGTNTNRAVIHGVVTVNQLYPNSRWAQAFSSIEWLHDPTFNKPPRLPVELLEIKDWEE